MQFLYYKNKILHLLHGRLPKSVFLWYVILVVSIIVTIGLISAWYYDVYKIYTGQSVQSLEIEEYEPTLDLTGLDSMVDKLGL